ILCHDDIVLPGHGLDQHSHGFGSPVGYWTDPERKPEELSLAELEELGLHEGESGVLHFQSGVKVKGRIRGFLFRDGKLLIISWDECTVHYHDQVLFDPSWGVYDMAVGASICSAFAGPADPSAFGLSYEVPSEKTHKIVHSPEARILHSIYGDIRRIRSQQHINGEAQELWARIRTLFPTDWLAPLELLEILHKNNDHKALAEDLRTHLENLKDKQPGLRKLINDGLALLA
ncbi:MAG: phenylalanine 4-monooxygenase, partial [Bacteroidales bacterium]|nr:phenylalanine 4-monooxygenase [Bacteroidales bacterium]